LKSLVSISPELSILFGQLVGELFCKGFLIHSVNQIQRAHRYY